MLKPPLVRTGEAVLLLGEHLARILLEDAAPGHFGLAELLDVAKQPGGHLAPLVAGLPGLVRLDDAVHQVLLLVLGHVLGEVDVGDPRLAVAVAEVWELIGSAPAAALPLVRVTGLGAVARLGVAGVPVLIGRGTLAVAISVAVLRARAEREIALAGSRLGLWLGALPLLLTLPVLLARARLLASGLGLVPVLWLVAGLRLCPGLGL